MPLYFHNYAQPQGVAYNLLSGKAWLQLTKGTDITEAFETAHVHEGADRLLQKYYVKDITTPRHSPYTFHENGFYKTLKRKVNKDCHYYKRDEWHTLQKGLNRQRQIDPGMQQNK